MSLKPLCYSSSFNTGNEARKTCCSDFSYGKMTDTLDQADSWLKFLLGLTSSFSTQPTVGSGMSQNLKEKKKKAADFIGK